MKKIIFFELNEVPYRILDDFCKTHPQSHIAKCMPQLRQYTTRTEDVGHLSPWVIWPSLHRGVNNTLHGLSEIGQQSEAASKKYPPIWQLLKNAGVKTAVFGSLGSYPPPSQLHDYAFYVPDTFAHEATTHPANLEIFQKLNLTLVKKSGRNVYGGLPLAESCKFLLSALGLGVRLQTLVQAAKQIILEKINAKLKIRRRTFQSILAFDIFYKYLVKDKPEFVTFFTNHVASSMHRYWAARYPNDYQKNEFDQKWIQDYGGEIDYSMGVFDQFFAELKAFCDRNTDYELWILSGMGQGPTRSKPVFSELNIKDLNKFMQKLGVSTEKLKVLTAMFPQINFSIDPTSLQIFKERISQLKINGENIHYSVLENSTISMDLGHPNLPDDQKVEFAEQLFSLESFGLVLQKNEDQSTSSAYHIPEGIFLIYDPKQKDIKNDRQFVSTLEVAPLLLENFGVPVPSYMKNDRRTQIA